jgi:hypothetical protein
MEESNITDKNMSATMREQAIANKKVQESLSTKLEKEREKFSLEAAKADFNLH